MKKHLLTDVELRASWHRTRGDTIVVAPGTLLTPAARDFLRENGIQLQFAETMTRVPVPMEGGRPRFIDERTGEALSEKPEDMTHLSGNRLVSKLHPRIAFRGRLDSLTAQILCLQAEALEVGRPALSEALGEILARTREILGAEVREQPLPEARLLGMTDAELRHASHDVKASCGIDHPIPNCGMGSLALKVNLLRTQVREAELSAMAAFSEGGVCTRPDLVRALNRLSSAVYLIFCRLLAGRLDQRR